MTDLLTELSIFLVGGMGQVVVVSTNLKYKQQNFSANLNLIMVAGQSELHVILHDLNSGLFGTL